MIVMTKKLLIALGIALMAAGILSLVTALFYEFKVKPEMAKRGQASAQSSASAKKESDPHARPSGIEIEALMKHSQGKYGADESTRKEGTLWVDQAGKRLVVNLGVLNGLKVGDGLGVFDHDLQVGRVKVLDVFDVVAYVEAEGVLEGPMDKNYYRVVKE